MKLPTLIIVSYLATLSSCVAAAKKPAASSKTKTNNAAELEEDSKEDSDDAAAHNPVDSTASEETPATTEPAEKEAQDAGNKQTMPVPNSNKVVYRPLGLTPGGYAAIKEAVWPDRCVKGNIVPTTGPLFPFNEAQTLVVRGPLDLGDMVVYEKKGDSWSRLADLSDLKWNENDFGTIHDLGTYPLKGKTLENGRELYAHLPSKGEKIVVVKVKMPNPSDPVYSSSAQDNVPAVWMLNSKIFQAPSSQYFCNCRGVGNPGGCGELDIAEIIPENKTEITTTLYTYEGARGGVLKNPRPTNNYQIYAAVLRVDGDAGEVAVLEMDSFDFSAKEFVDSFVSSDWLPKAKPLNKGSESLNPPGR